MPTPLVTGISPREGCPGIKITIRGENLGNDEKDFIALKICGDDCRASASWISPNKIVAYAGNGQGKGDVIVVTKSGGIGSCSVGFYGRVEQAGKSLRLLSTKENLVSFRTIPRSSCMDRRRCCSFIWFKY
jgi:exocyst complex component 2